MNCYAYDPGNVCGWPAGEGEIDCYQECALDYAAANDGIYDEGAVAECDYCANTACDGNFGNATNALVGCIVDNCVAECFEP
jgi:hypothetical protein